MRIQVVHKGGQQEILTVVGPLLQVTETLREDGMGSFRDAAGTDYYFNESDGTFDGWGRSVPGASSEEMDGIMESVEEAREFVAPEE